jgi:hypothetical protein
VTSSRVTRTMRVASLLLVTTLPILAVACGDGEDTTSVDSLQRFPRLTGEHPASCDGYHDRLSACGLLTAGRFDCSEPANEVNRCVFECLTAASCELLWEARCGAVFPFALDRCFTECQTFECGDGTAISKFWVCDGEVDCFLTGVDEVDCDLFQCGSGEGVPHDNVCDGYPHCFDGSDEDGCPVFACETTTELIPEVWVCDFAADCSDGSDEANCPIFTCIGDGSTIPLIWQCDQEHDCLDGSDERGCAELICR